MDTVTVFERLHQTQTSSQTTIDIIKWPIQILIETLSLRSVEPQHLLCDCYKAKPHPVILLPAIRLPRHPPPPPPPRPRLCITRFIIRPGLCEHNQKLPQYWQPARISPSSRIKTSILALQAVLQCLSSSILDLRTPNVPSRERR
jgi:hypothetical protein